MKLAKKFTLVVVITSGLVWAQSTTPQTPPANTQGETAAGSAKSTQTQPSTRPGRGMPGAQAMHDQQMQEMQASMTRMHALLNSMRAGYGSMDAKDQPAMQANIEMWQLMLDHLDRMVQHMQSMQGRMGEGGMQHHRGMGMTPQTQPGTTTNPPPK